MKFFDKFIFLQSLEDICQIDEYRRLEEPKETIHLLRYKYSSESSQSNKMVIFNIFYKKIPSECTERLRDSCLLKACSSPLGEIGRY